MSNKLHRNFCHFHSFCYLSDWSCCQLSMGASCLSCLSFVNVCCQTIGLTASAVKNAWSLTYYKHMSCVFLSSGMFLSTVKRHFCMFAQPVNLICSHPFNDTSYNTSVTFVKNVSYHGKFLVWCWYNTNPSHYDSEYSSAWLILSAMSPSFCLPPVLIWWNDQRSSANICPASPMIQSPHQGLRYYAEHRRYRTTSHIWCFLFRFPFPPL